MTKILELTSDGVNLPHPPNLVLLIFNPMCISICTVNGRYSLYVLY